MFSLGLIIEFPLFGRFLKGIMNGSHAKSNFGVKLQWRFCIYGAAFVNYSKKLHLPSTNRCDYMRTLIRFKPENSLCALFFLPFFCCVSSEFQFNFAALLGAQTLFVFLVRFFEFSILVIWVFHTVTLDFQFQLQLHIHG